MILTFVPEEPNLPPTEDPSGSDFLRVLAINCSQSVAIGWPLPVIIPAGKPLSVLAAGIAA